MNGMHFYLKTTSKIVVTLLFLTKKLRELDLASPEKTRSLNKYPLSKPNFLVNVSVNFGAGALDVTEKVTRLKQ